MMKGLALLLPCILFSCSELNDDGVPQATLVELNLPLGFPTPTFRTDNPMTVESVVLGRLLFNDKRLSKDGSLSCGSCHIAAEGFADGHAVSPGVGEKRGFRNTPSIINIVYHDEFFMDGGAVDLETQLLAPIHTEAEMEGNIHATAELIKNEEPYRTLSETAYGRELDGYVISRAIANFERALVSGNSRFDKWRHGGDEGALSEEEKRGWELFSSSKTNCSGCHSGHLFSDLSYQNIGLYEEYEDRGRGRISNDSADDGKFKVPSLRDVTKTAPYMHDGSIPSLEEVIEHFASGGKGHTNQSKEIKVLTLSAQEKGDIIAFLSSLEGELVGELVGSGSQVE